MMTESERLRFELCSARIASEGLSGAGIGTYSEKRLHRVLKHYFCEDESCHEVRIRPDGVAVTDPEERARGAESGRGGFIADIYRDGEIIEIQTGGFYPLRQKLSFYLENTDYNVVLIHPIAESKWISTISRDGKIGHRKKSPKT